MLSLLLPGGWSCSLRLYISSLGLLCVGLTLDWPWTWSYPLHQCTVMTGLYVTWLSDFGPNWHTLVVLLSLSGCMRHQGESSSAWLYVLTEYWCGLLMRDVFSFETWVDRSFTLWRTRLPDGPGSHPLPVCSAPLSRWVVALCPPWGIRLCLRLSYRSLHPVAMLGIMLLLYSQGNVR